MFIDPYQTTVGLSLSTDPSRQQIKTALAARMPFLKPQTNNTVQIMANNTVRPFEHPLYVQGSRVGEGNWCIDMSRLSRETDEGQYSIRDRSLYSLQAMRCGLVAAMENSTSLYYSLPASVMGSYIDLISNSVTLAFSLNADDLLTLRALSGWMYFSMLQNGKDCSTEQRELYMMHIRKATMIPQSFLDRVIPQESFYANVGEFIESLKERIDSPVINGLNVGVFHTTVSKNLKSSMLIGVAADEIICMAIEHLPSWLALIGVGLTEPAFKKTGFGKIVERQFKRDRNAGNIVINAINAAVNIDI